MLQETKALAPFSSVGTGGAPSVALVPAAALSDGGAANAVPERSSHAAGRASLEVNMSPGWRGRAVKRRVIFVDLI